MNKFVITSKSSLNSLVQFTGIQWYYIRGKITANKEAYIQIASRLKGVVRRKRSEKCITDIWFLLDENDPAHRSVLIKDFLPKNNVTTLEHLPCTDMAPADFTSSFV